MTTEDDGSYFPTAAAAINSAVPGRAFGDDDILAHCPICKSDVPLGGSAVTTTRYERRYSCASCRTPLVIIRRANHFGVEESGYLLGEWTFANAVDVHIKGHAVRFPGNKNATSVKVSPNKRGSVDRS